jgi:hypothetical protein
MKPGSSQKYPRATITLHTGTAPLPTSSLRQGSLRGGRYSLLKPKQGSLLKLLLFNFYFETGSHCIVQAGLELIGSGNPPTSASPGAVSIDVHHCIHRLLLLESESHLPPLTVDLPRPRLGPLPQTRLDRPKQDVYPSPVPL